MRRIVIAIMILEIGKAVKLSGRADCDGVDMLNVRLMQWHMTMHVDGTRQKGHPRATWCNCVHKDMRSSGLFQ